MGTRLDDLDQYWSPGLTLTVRGRDYTLPLPSAELGLWCRRLAEVTGEVHNASSEQEIQAAVARIEALPQLPGDLSLPERVLGDVYQQMAADQVPDPHIQFCGQTGYIWIIGGEDAAERYWTTGGRPEAQRPTNRKERRAQNRARTGGNRTAGDGKTPPPASTSGTTSLLPPGRRNRGRRKAR